MSQYSPEEYTVGYLAVAKIIDELEMTGMSRADALDEAFDYCLSHAGGHIVRTGEVLLVSEDVVQGDFRFDLKRGAVAMCVNTAQAVA